MNKQEEFLKLVKEVKRCEVCKGIKAPAYCEGGEYLVNDSHGFTDKGEIGADGVYINKWNLWHGNLDAEIMVIGQDYGKVEDGEKITSDDWRSEKGKPFKFATDKKLVEIFSKIFEGKDIGDLSKRGLPLFFTNLACCYRTINSTGVTNDAWYALCANKFMGRLIRIIQPKVIVALGLKTFQYLSCCEGMEMICVSEVKPTGCLTMTELLDSRYKFSLRARDGKLEIPVVPVFHPGANMGRNRKEDEKVYADWAVIREIIDKENMNMSYSRDLLKKAEKYAFQQLDGINHSAGYYRLSDYAHFYFNGKMIIDPWQDETYQYGDCMWVEYDEEAEIHRGQHVVNPYEYYGKELMDEYVRRILILAGER